MGAGHRQTNPYQAYDIEAAHNHYAEHVFDQPDIFPSARSRVGIDTSPDPRCIPKYFFEMKGNEAFVIRNEEGERPNRM